MPANKSSLRVSFMERFNSKIGYQKCFFTNIGNDYSLEIKRKKRKFGTF